LFSDDLHELVIRPGLPMEGYVLCDIQLQALDVLIQGPHVGVSLPSRDFHFGRRNRRDATPVDASYGQFFTALLPTL
jgi:hypothetical protein